MFKRVMWFAVLMVAVPAIGFACGVGVLRLVQALNATPPMRHGDFRAITADVGAPVVLLSTRTCPWCEKTRIWLDAQGIDYRDCVVDEDAFAAGLLDRVGGDSVPQLLNAQSAASGYDPELFARIVFDVPAQQADTRRCNAPDPVRHVTAGKGAVAPSATSVAPAL